MLPPRGAFIGGITVDGVPVTGSPDSSRTECIIRPMLVPSTGLLVLLDFVSLFLSLFLY